MVKPPVPPTGAKLTARDNQFRDDPDHLYDLLREHAPFHDDPDYGRTVLTRYDDVRAALRDKNFSVEARHSHANSYMRRVAGTGIDEQTGDTAYEPPLVLLDDPDHRRIRSLMSKAFNPQSIEALRPAVEAITAELLDKLNPSAAIDFIAEFAGPLPTQAILHMMGMQSANVADFKRWSEHILMGYDPDRDRKTQINLRNAYLAMASAFQEQVAKRRAAPGNDLISAMVRAQNENDSLSDLEIISLCTQLMVAGNVTTTDLIGSGLYALLTHPGELQKLKANPGLIESAVEEMLRFDCPITETARFPLQDAALNGCPVHQGQTLTASLAAANHDPVVFTQPHEFDIERQSNRHLAFGSGIHTCLGAPLARLEAQIAIGELLRRFPNVRLAESERRTRKKLPFFRGFQCLHIHIR